MSCKQPINQGTKILLVVFIMTLYGVTAGSDTIPPQIYMNTGMEQFEPGVIKARIHDDSEVSKATLFYRKTGEDYYNSVDMKSENDIYYRKLNREFGVTGAVEYFILAQDVSGNQTTQPVLSPEENPMRAAMDSDTNQSAPEVFLTNPVPGAELDTGDEPIMVTFYNVGREVDFNTVRFKIDRRDRTREASFVGNVLIWQPRRDLTEGFHEIEIIVRDTEGDYIGPNIWTFRVKTKMEIPLGAEGDVYLGFQRDDRSGSSHNVPLWNNKVDMSINGQTGWLRWRAGAMLSSEETSFLTSEKLPVRQPVNRYFLEGRSRHFRVLIGDSNPNFSDLTLKGTLVRGFNLEFKSDRLNAQIVKGYTKREVDQDINIIAKNVTRDPADPNKYLDENGDEQTISSSFQEIIDDPVSGKVHVYEFVPGTFQRDVTALQMDVTPVKNRRANWKLGLNLFSAEDDSTTLKYNYNVNEDVREYSYDVDDTLTVNFVADYKPKKNWAGTIESSLLFNDNRSKISAEFGGTLVTDNMFGAVSENMQEELPDEIKDELFRINASTQTSFDKEEISVFDAIRSVYKLRLTTPLWLPIPNASTYFKSELYRVPTHYVSLGNPQQKTDIGGYKFDIRSRVLRDQITFNVGFDSYSDNLDNERKQYASVDSSGMGFYEKNLNKDTNITTFSLSLKPKRWVDYAPRVTIGLRSYNAQNDLDLAISANDTTNMIDTSTSTLMLNFGGVIPVGVQRHNTSLSISNMSISDSRPLADYDLNESDNLTVMVNVNSILNPLPLNIITTIGHTSNKAFWKESDDLGRVYRKEVTTGIMMLNLSGTYKWFRDKRLRTTAGLGYLGSSNGETDRKIDNNKVSIKFEADYRLSSVSSIGGLFKFIKYSDNARTIIDNSYSEPVFGINLKSTF